MADIKVVKNLKILAEELALGSGSSVIGDKGIALGYNTAVRIDKSYNIAGLPLIRNDLGEDDIIQNFGGPLAVLFWKEYSLKSVTDYTYALPSGALFFPVQLGVIVTAANNVTVQPTIRFGYTGTLAGFLAAVATAGLAAAGDRAQYTTLVTYAGKASLSAGVTVTATATELKGRFYMIGMWVESE